MRLFVGVWPSAEVMAEVGALSRPPVDGVRWTTPDQWHATVSFLGEVPDAPGLLEELDEALLRAAAEHGPAEATVGPVTRRLGPQVLCVPVSGLEALATSVRRQLVGVIDAPVDDRLADGRLRPFHGHLTLARARRGRRIPHPLVGVPVSARWPVDHLSLVSSRLGPGGSRYDTLVQAPLDGRPGR
ncbi:MAG: RNA 2',3'-cyclic phosphodiesterase [Acidimicrobiales bacterium]